MGIILPNTEEINKYDTKKDLMTNKYDFTRILDRRDTGSEKWNLMLDGSRNIPGGIVPLSVADMEFNLPPPIAEGLKNWLSDCVLGYTEPTGEYYNEVIRWMERRHNFSPEKEWFVLSAGVVPAIFDMVSALTRKGDRILITPPVYYPFRIAIEACGRKVAESPLVPEGNTYNIDFDDFERKCSDDKVTMFILCSPHNPVGRVWTKDELARICEICLKHKVFIISDEIHSDLILPGNRHVSLGTFEEKYLKNCAVCTSPSKTFNLAGLQCSNIFIADEGRRNKLSQAKGYFSLNAFAYPACIFAYRDCEDWLGELLAAVDGNKRLAEDFITNNLPEAKVYDLQGTYLQWIDFGFLGFDNLKLEKFMHEKAYIFADEGYIFGTGGSGFERLNLACPQKVIESALERLCGAIKARA